MDPDDPMDPQTLHPGDALPGEHRVDELLANGRLGAGYVVFAEGGERRAANVLHREHVADLGEWFFAAATLRKGIEHAHMPRTFETGALDDGRPVEITELLEGESLREAVANRSVPLPLPVVARIVREIASALDDLHRRAPPVVHRALTPENVLLTAPDGLVKLLGVGDADRPSIDDVRAGYQSPEALAEIASLTPRADVFVLASLAYEALTGRSAFSGTADQVLGSLHRGARPALVDLRPEVPAAADAVLRQCWELSPERRPASAGEAARELSVALGAVDTGEVSVPDEPTNQVVSSLRVLRRRNALLGPTIETTRPAVDPRSFLENVERTEVSLVGALPSSPAPEQPQSQRPSAAPRAVTTLRGGASKLALSRPTEAAGEVPRADATAPEPGAPDDESNESRRRNDPTDPGMHPQRRPAAPTLHDTIDTSAQSKPTPIAEVAPLKGGTLPSPFSNDPRSTLPTSVDAVVPPALTPEPEAPRAAPMLSPFSAPTVPTLKGMQSLPVPTAPSTATLPGVVAPHDEAAAPPSPSESEPEPVSAAVAPDGPATLPLPPPEEKLPLPSSPFVPASQFAPQPGPAPRPVQQTAPPSVAQPLPQPVPQPATSLQPAPQPAPQSARRSRSQRAPDDMVFPDEPTQTFALAPEAPSPWRSPWVIASIFLANAIMIVGIAHAIALAASREPLVRVVQTPAPVCAPCASCPACAPCAPAPAQRPNAPQARPGAAQPATAAPPRRSAGIIRDVPVFGAPRRR